MTEEKLDQILNLVVEFAQSRSDILAVGLCGSWARGESRPDSDIDFNIIVEDKVVFESVDWFKQFPFQKIDDAYVSHRDEIYGVTWSRHVVLDSGNEIEFGFAEKSWAITEPVDEGTRNVVSNGYRVIYDPTKLLKKLVQTIIQKD